MIPRSVEKKFLTNNVQRPNCRIDVGTFTEALDRDPITQSKCPRNPTTKTTDTVDYCLQTMCFFLVIVFTWIMIHSNLCQNVGINYLKFIGGFKVIAVQNC